MQRQSVTKAKSSSSASASANRSTPESSRRRNDEVDNDDDDEEEDTGKYVEHLLERAKLRGDLKSILNTIELVEEEMKKNNSNKFKTLHDQINEMFEGVEYVREMTLDATALKAFSKALRAQALQLNDLSKQYNFDTFVERLHHKFIPETNQYIDWVMLGHEVEKIFNSPLIPFTTMNGPFLKEEKVRKQIVRRKVDDEDKHRAADKPKEIVQNDDDQAEATNARVQHLLQEVRNRSKPKSTHKVGSSDQLDYGEAEPFDLLELLVDPEDPIQTVENFFDFSFLIKTKQVAYDFDPDAEDKLIAAASDPDKLEESEKKQMVLTMNMTDIRALAELIYGEKCSPEDHPLHRNDPIYKGKMPSNKKHSDEDEDEEEEEIVETIGKKRSAPAKSSQKDSQKVRRKN